MSNIKPRTGWHLIRRVPANALNHTKLQKPVGECEDISRFSNHPDDVSARVTTIMDNKRARWKSELLDDVPPERIYMAVSDTPPGAPETGIDNSYVTQSSNSINLVWNRQTRKLEHATSYSQAQRAKPPKAETRASWGNGKSRQGGAGR